MRMFCNTIARREQARYEGLAYHARDTSLQIEILIHDGGYEDGKVQGFADRIEAMFAEDQWELFFFELAKKMPIEMPPTTEGVLDEEWHKRLCEKIGEILLPGLRNVGSRGKENADWR